MAQSSIEDVRKSLVELERRLEAPLMPGELTSWANMIRDSAGTVQPQLVRLLSQSHSSQYAEMGEQDVSLAPRVEELKKEDAALLKEFDRFVEDARRFADAAGQVEPDEGSVEQVRGRFADDGLQLVLRIRKQEAAVRAWYMEAFRRDEGVGD